MTEKASRIRIRFRIRPAGVLACVIPVLIALPGGVEGTSPPSLVIGGGLLAAAVLSLLFLLMSLPFIYRQLGTSGIPADSLPGELLPGTRHVLEADPSRPRFLPGVRLSVLWKLRFGPFRQILRIPLAAEGKSSRAITLKRRGLWQGFCLLEAADPFGFFVFELYDTSVHHLAVPPLERTLAGSSVRGRPAYDTASAPRPREDAEELLERREYRPGDDTRRLDWKQFARTGDMLVRIGDDTVPLQGRVWLEVHSVIPPWRRKPGIRQIQRLDEGLKAADALVRRLRESGQEIMVRLPGEAIWKGAASGEWRYRLASALPESGSMDPPAAEDTPWLILHPMETGIRKISVSLAKRVSPETGVILGMPADDDSHGGRIRGYLYRRFLRHSAGLAAKAGFDVRFI